MLCAVLAFLFASTLLVRAEPPLPPKPDRYFNDYAKVVPPDAGARINAKLEQFERDTSNQVLVAVFPKIPDGTYLEDFTVKTAQAWGPGGKKRDNGIVLFAFIQDRKVRIEAGYGLEGVVPDSIAASIIREVIAPQFKKGDYAAGLDQGVDAIFKATRNEYKGTGGTVAEGRRQTGGGGSGNLPVLIGLILLVVFLVWCQMGDTAIQRGGRFIFWNLLVNIVFSGRSSGGGSSGGGGGGGGGGGFSGGGGSFGGGGASGGW